MVIVIVFIAACCFSLFRQCSAEHIKIPKINPTTDLRSSLLNAQRMSGKSPSEFAKHLQYFLRWVVLIKWVNNVFCCGDFAKDSIM